jgi:hypothetical protein
MTPPPASFKCRVFATLSDFFDRFLVFMALPFAARTVATASQ